MLNETFSVIFKHCVFFRADSSVAEDKDGEPPLNNGLSKFGQTVVKEMNRLGIMVDLAHVSANTMRDALQVSRAPVIFSHSSARSVNNVSRNVPDDVLQQVVSFLPDCIPTRKHL